MTPRRSRLLHALSLVVGIGANAAARVLNRFHPQRWVTPWISLTLYRLSSRMGYAQTIASVRRHHPATPTWTTRSNLAYAPGRNGRFDLVVPDGPGPHPWLLWVHGGGWQFGSKEYSLPYVELLAQHGIAGVVVNYPLAPRSAYPAAPTAVNNALAHALANAEEFGLDPTRVVMAGDSAGAQVAAQVAALTTNSDYAAACGIVPALTVEQLRGVLLFCGIYDTAALDDSGRAFSAGLESAMWSLSRTRRWQGGEVSRQMSVRHHVTADFPPTFLAAGNADPLTPRQTPPMASRLLELGVEVDGYYPGTVEHPVDHEFQYWLATPEGVEAFARVRAFLEKVTAG